LLINPYPESSLNEEAGKLFLNNYNEYFSTAKMYSELYALKKKTPGNSFLKDNKNIGNVDEYTIRNIKTEFVHNVIQSSTMDIDECANILKGKNENLFKNIQNKQKRLVLNDLTILQNSGFFEKLFKTKLEIQIEMQKNHNAWNIKEVKKWLTR